MKISIRDMALVSLFTALTAISAFISLPLGPVAITMQSLFVLLSGLILGPKLGALSQVIYIILGLIGLPIFSGFTGGLQSFLKPSFGFIIGFVFAAYIVGKISDSKNGLSLKRIVLATLTGSLVIYIFGLPYMYYILNIVMGQSLSFKAIFNMGFLLFLPGDFIKLILSSILGKKLLAVPAVGRQSFN